MSEVKIKELQEDVAELKKLLEQASRKKVKDILSLEVRKFETELIKLNEVQNDKKPCPAPIASTTAAGSSQRPDKRYQVKLNGYGWGQTDKHVKVIVTLKNVQNITKEQINLNLTENSMELQVQNLENKDYVLTINNLLEPIDTEKSYWKQKTDMVLVYLAKALPNRNWSHMTEIERKFDDERNNRFKPDNDKTKDPQESIMSLMKDMYEKGDDDMKRMISKAWYEGQKNKTSTIDDLGSDMKNL